MLFLLKIRQISSNNLQQTPKSVTALDTEIDADAGKHTYNVSPVK